MRRVSSLLASFKELTSSFKELTSSFKELTSSFKELTSSFRDLTSAASAAIFVPKRSNSTALRSAKKMIPGCPCGGHKLPSKQCLQQLRPQSSQ